MIHYCFSSLRKIVYKNYYHQVLGSRNSRVDLKYKNTYVDWHKESCRILLIVDFLFADSFTLHKWADFAWLQINLDFWDSYNM